MRAERLNAAFSALADPTRRAILARLAEGDASLTELAEPFAMTLPAVAKHVKVLEGAGLIVRGRDAQRRPCRLAPQALADLDAWLDGYRRLWAARFNRLDAVLEEMKRDPARGAGPKRKG